MSKQPDSVLIFAAGFGTRMGTLTANRPKPLVPVAGKPMIDYAIAIARDADMQKVVVNLHYKHKMLTQHLLGQGIDFSTEQPNILDTGGGLRQALPLLGTGPVFTLNSDAIWVGQNPLSMLSNTWDPDKMDALLMLVSSKNRFGHTGDGDFRIDPEGKLVRGPDLVYSGAQIIKTDLLKDIPKTAFSVNLLWDAIVEKQRLFGLSYTGKWCDVGNPQGLETAESLF